MRSRLKKSINDMLEEVGSCHAKVLSQHKLDDEGLLLTSLLQIILLTSNVCFGLPKNCVSDGHFPALVMDKWIFFLKWITAERN